MKRFNHGWLTLLIVFGLVLSACAAPKGPVAAPAPEKPGVATPQAPQAQLTREQQLIEGAKREGEVVLWTSSIVNAKDIFGPFEARYPFLRVKLWDAPGATDIFNRMVEEAAVGRNSVDLITASQKDIPRPRVKDLFSPYEWPNTKNWPRQPVDGYFAGIAGTVRGTAYNTDLISDAEAPKSWEDLNSTKWRGKAMMSYSPIEVPLTFAYFWGEGGKLNWEKSFSFLGEVIKNTRPLVRRGQPMELLAAGEVGIFIMGSLTRALEFIWKGAPMEIARAPRVSVEYRSLLIAKNAPHPNAARLFADYLTSLEGQLAYSTATSMIVVSPEADKKARANLEFSRLRIELEETPIALFTEENLKKSRDFWLTALGIK